MVRYEGQLTVDTPEVEVPGSSEEEVAWSSEDDQISLAGMEIQDPLPLDMVNESHISPHTPFQAPRTFSNRISVPRRQGRISRLSLSGQETPPKPAPFRKSEEETAPEPALSRESEEGLLRKQLFPSNKKHTLRSQLRLRDHYFLTSSLTCAESQGQLIPIGSGLCWHIYYGCFSAGRW
jgi:hypothetical protein